jgi:hypothetical protein
MEKNVSKLVYWTPRILAILFLLFLSLFSLDVFEEGNDFWGTFLALLIHNIPAFVLALVLVISWKKYEIVGGIAFLLVGIAHMIFSIARETIDPWYIALSYSLILDIPAFFIGALFLIGWFKKRR